MSQGPVFSVVPCPAALTGTAGLYGAVLMGLVFTVRAAGGGSRAARTAKTSASILCFLRKKCKQRVSRAKRCISLSGQQGCQSLLL